MPLGKSLGNLLGDYFGDEAVSLNIENGQPQVHLQDQTLVTKIPVEKIKLNPYQTRSQFDFTKIQSLADSIKHSGLIHPIVVLSRKIEPKDVEDPQVEYILLAGERRLRACKLLDHKEIWAVIKAEESLTSSQQAMITAVENLQREDLTPIELAKTYQMLMQTQNLDEEALAETLGFSTQYVKNYLRLLTLSLPVQQALLDRLIGEGQARFLVGLPETRQIDLLEVIIEKSLTVKEIIQLLKREQATSNLNQTSKNLPHNLNTEVVSKAQRLAEHFPKAKLKCTGDENKGKIVITWG
jgi:ParB family transcriptional regulator, chromosome partitioning protein